MKKPIQRRKRNTIAIDLAKTSGSSPPNPSSLTTEEEFLTTEEAALFLKVSAPTLRTLTNIGKIPYYKLGRLNRYSKSELLRLLLANARGVSYERN